MNPPPSKSSRSEYHRSTRWFYSSARWRKFRLWFLRRNPICVGYPPPCSEPASQVDHIVPIHDGGGDLDPDNCQPLCQHCHSRKTADDVRRRSDGEGGSKTCGPNRRLPPVQLKKTVRRFLRKGVTSTANSPFSGADALRAAQKRREGRLAFEATGCKGNGARVKGGSQ